jgi:hypothetical protein
LGFRDLRERGIGGREDSEWALALQGLDQVGLVECRCEGLEVARVGRRLVAAMAINLFMENSWVVGEDL